MRGNSDFDAVDGVYTPDEYWEHLLTERFSLRGVGYPALPESFNRALYLAMKRAVIRALRNSAPDALNGAHVLDVGAGVGFWVEFWHAAGAASVTGIDIAATSVARLQEQFPEDTFIQNDIAVLSAE